MREIPPGTQVQLATPRATSAAQRSQLNTVLTAFAGDIEGAWLVRLTVPGYIQSPEPVLVCAFKEQSARKIDSVLGRLGVVMGTAMPNAPAYELLSVLPGQPLYEPVQQVGVQVFPLNEADVGAAAAPEQPARRPWWRFGR